MTDYEHKVEAAAAFDKRHPQPSKNYGIHGVEFRFSVIGDGAAVSWGLSTGWQLPSVIGDAGDNSHDYRHALAQFDRGMHPMPMAICFHVAEPIRSYMKDQEVSDCDLLPGGKCWGDITFTGGDRPFFALIGGGLDAMWKQLETELESFVGSS